MFSANGLKYFDISQKRPIFARKDTMDTVDSSLLSFIFSSFPRGSVFFAEDLEPTGIPSEAIRFSLSRIVADQTSVVRLGRGIYCVPEQSSEYSGKFLMPSLDYIAESLARRWKVRIAPCGAQAAYLAGFTGLSLNQNTWVSDGSEQIFNLQNGKSIRFIKRKSMKVFQFWSTRMRNLVEALRYLGKDEIHAEGRGVIADNLQWVSDEEFLHDIRLSPSWIRELLREIRN